MRQDIQEDTVQLWMQNMRRGAFEAAWRNSDAVLQARAGAPCWHLLRHLQPIWNGAPLQGKRVLVRCYHGLGDTVQFIRYAPKIKAIAAEVIVWAQPPLLPLLETMQHIDQLVPLHDGKPEIVFDVDVEVMELPHIFRTTLHTIPAETPYLHVAPTELFPNEGQLSVGLIWKAGDWDERRSIPFALLAPLAQVPGIKLCILQADAAAAGWQQGFGTYAGTSSVFDFARVIRGLDLLITVDSMPAHLAGALGVPVWTLLRKDADWRWMEDRNDSPWYPTMQLFRQARAGDWNDVIGRVCAELEKLRQV